MEFDLVIVHVNHGIRGEAADADEEYVRDICRKLGLMPPADQPIEKQKGFSR